MTEKAELHIKELEVLLARASKELREHEIHEIELEDKTIGLRVKVARTPYGGYSSETWG